MSPSAYPSGAVNGSSPRPLARGIYVPTVVFFDPSTDQLDTKTVSKHAVRLAKAGVAGLAVQGSNGESVHLTHEERSTVTKTTRDALDAAGFTSMPLIVGCGAQSVVEAVSLCEQAAAAGGDYALILPPSYYCGLFTPSTIIDFFTGIADASPIPIIIYNYPGATPGVDINSDVLITLSQHANIIGCKFTCGNTGKLGRVASAVRKSGAEFLCFAGSTDFTLPSQAAGGAGVIGGMANLAPRASVKLFAMGEDKAQFHSEEATTLQEVVGRGDWAMIKTGFVGVKAALGSYFGYGGFGRRPMPRPDEKETARLAAELKELMDLEATLPDKQ